MTPTRDSATFSSSVEAVRERINTSNIISDGSTLETRSVDVGTSTSNIKSIMFQSTSSVKSVSDIPYPSTTSLTDKSTLPAKGFITTTPLSRSTVDRGSPLRSQTVTPVSSSLPFVVSSSDGETFVLTTQKPSQVVSVSMKDKTSTHDLRHNSA
ncbi:hypothetical protein OS493_035708 [Desmophyllum pertusum]|uniref:Uncharacterized protein n=1 Tax=Desmophyllum pertusum TaxID=174260 RepID=A0A9W9YIC4_9CNID|nr:hypothetical protein OS493_035708 [Desmophyllum pertusum]